MSIFYTTKSLFNSIVHFPFRVVCVLAIGRYAINSILYNEIKCSCKAHISIRYSSTGNQILLQDPLRQTKHKHWKTIQFTAPISFSTRRFPAYARTAENSILTSLLKRRNTK